MQYVRKKSKGFGRNAQIEGQVIDGESVLLVEGHDRRRQEHKVNFVQGAARYRRQMRARFRVVFP